MVRDAAHAPALPAAPPDGDGSGGGCQLLQVRGHVGGAHAAVLGIVQLRGLRQLLIATFHSTGTTRVLVIRGKGCIAPAADSCA